MTSPSPPTSRRKKLVFGLLIVLGVCSGFVGIGVFVAVRYGHRPRTTLGRFVVFTAAGSGIIGGVVGLIIGLAYPPTALFAAVEVAIASVAAGALIGLVLGSLAVGIQGVLRARPGRMA